MLCENDFIWQEHFENNIPNNPLGEYYCIIDVGNHARKYSVVPQYPSKDGICVNRDCEPEYYVLFESCGHKANIQERQDPFYQSYHFNGYVFGHNSFIRVFKTFEDAKKRAYIQYKSIFGYVLSHIEPDIETATKNHVCVN